MKKWLRGLFAAFTALAGCTVLIAQQQGYPPQIGPVSFGLNGVSPSPFSINGLTGQSFCSVSINAGATMGGASLGIYTTTDNTTWYPVSGVADLGNPATPSSTMTAAGTQASFPVAGKSGLQLQVVSGSGTTSITGSVTCNQGTGTIGGGGGGGGATNATIVAPTGNPDGQNAILAHVTNPTLPPGPLPTALAGAAPPASTAQMVTYPACFSYSGVVNITAGNAAACAIDQRAHVETIVCGNNLSKCASVATGQVNASLSYSGPNVDTKTVVTTTCTNLFATATLLVHVVYPATSGTAILNIYNESAATCAAADLVYTSSAAITTPTYVPWAMALSAGLTYQWSVAAPTNAAYIGTI